MEKSERQASEGEPGEELRERRVMEKSKRQASNAGEMDDTHTA